jgi:hypothetical protein
MSVQAARRVKRRQVSELPRHSLRVPEVLAVDVARDVLQPHELTHDVVLCLLQHLTEAGEQGLGCIMPIQAEISGLRSVEGPARILWESHARCN